MQEFEIGVRKPTPVCLDSVVFQRAIGVERSGMVPKVLENSDLLMVPLDAR